MNCGGLETGNHVWLTYSNHITKWTLSLMHSLSPLLVNVVLGGCSLRLLCAMLCQYDDLLCLLSITHKGKQGRIDSLV